MHRRRLVLAADKPLGDCFRTLHAVTPWYRERWPWLLILGPAAVLVAGAITTWIAFASADGLVAEDYYKQGLGINRLLAREDTGRRLGVSADLEIEQGAMTVKMAGAAPLSTTVMLDDTSMRAEMPCSRAASSRARRLLMPSPCL